MSNDVVPDDTGPSEYEHVYAIIRVDLFHGPQIPLVDKIKIKMLVWSQDLAESEVKRLNGLNEEKGVLYFSQRARLAKRNTEV